MITWFLCSLGLSLLVTGIVRLVVGPDQRRRIVQHITINITTDYETLRRLGADPRAQDEIARLERAYRR